MRLEPSVNSRRNHEIMFNDFEDLPRHDKERIWRLFNEFNMSDVEKRTFMVLYRKLRKKRIWGSICINHLRALAIEVKRMYGKPVDSQGYFREIKLLRRYGITRSSWKKDMIVDEVYRFKEIFPQINVVETVRIIKENYDRLSDMRLRNIIIGIITLFDDVMVKDVVEKIGISSKRCTDIRNTIKRKLGITNDS